MVTRAGLIKAAIGAVLGTHMPSIEERLRRLEAAITSSSPTEETLPTYLSVDPTTGSITAQFTGGLLLQEAPSSPLPTNIGAIQWQDSSGSVREFIQSQVPGLNYHELDVGSTPDGSLAGDNFAYISFRAKPLGLSAPGNSVIDVAVRDHSPAQSVQILDGNGASDFMFSPLGSNVSSIGTVTFGTPRQPNILHPVLVCAGIQVQVNLGGNIAEVDLRIASSSAGAPTGFAVGTVLSEDPTSGAFASITRVGVSAIIPAGWWYVINNVSDPAAANAIAYVTEMIL